MLPSVMVWYDRDALRLELVHDQGFHLEPYQDKQGVWKVGVGYRLKLQVASRPRKISEFSAFALLDKDIAEAENRLDRMFQDWRELDAIRQRALVRLVFELRDQLERRKVLLEAIRKHKWADAGHSLYHSRWRTQMKSRASGIIHQLVSGTPWTEK